MKGRLTGGPRMHGARFDAITKLWAAATRRQMLSALLGGALVGAGLKRPQPAAAEVRPWYCCRYDCAEEQDRHTLLCTSPCAGCTATCDPIRAFPDPETSVIARCPLIDERFLGNIELGTCNAACSLEDFCPGRVCGNLCCSPGESCRNGKCKKDKDKDK
jgi:hypothetical protein